MDIFQACETGDIEYLRSLPAGEDWDQRDAQFGDTPLHIAIKSGQFELVRYLLEKGADVKARNDDGSNNRSNNSIVRFLIEHGADVNKRNIHNETPLYKACLSGDIDIARRLIDAGADPNAADKNGWTPLHWACRRAAVIFQDDDLVRLLIENGADAGARDDNGETPLDLVIRSSLREERKQEILKIFQEHAPELYFSTFCTTPSPGGM